jgi:large subunit ribosomal protein L2
MAIQVYKPTTPGRRGMTGFPLRTPRSRPRSRSAACWSSRSVPMAATTRAVSLPATVVVAQSATTVWSTSAWLKAPVATIEHIEYDPNRTANIARIKDQTGQYHYILASGGMTVGQTITSGEEAPIENGNRLKLKNIPVGSTIHGIELQPGKRSPAGPLRRQQRPADGQGRGLRTGPPAKRRSPPHQR